MAFENQDYQLEDLVEKVLPQREKERNPLFDTVFVSQHMEVGAKSSQEPTGGESGDRLKAATFGYINRVAKFDLAFFYNEIGEKIVFTLEYSTSLFKEETIHRFMRFFKEILSKLPGHKDREIGELALSTDLITAQVVNHDMDLDF